MPDRCAHCGCPSRRQNVTEIVVLGGKLVRAEHGWRCGDCGKNWEPKPK